MNRPKIIYICVNKNLYISGQVSCRYILITSKVIMQGKLFQRCTHLLYCSAVPAMGSIFYKKNQWNILVIGNYYVNYQTFKIQCFYPPRILNDNMYSKYTQLQLTFLVLLPWLQGPFSGFRLEVFEKLLDQLLLHSLSLPGQQ